MLFRSSGSITRSTRAMAWHWATRSKLKPLGGLGFDAYLVRAQTQHPAMRARMFIRHKPTAANGNIRRNELGSGAAEVVVVVVDMFVNAAQNCVPSE